MEWLNSLRETILRLRQDKSLPDASEKRKTYRIKCNLSVTVQVGKQEILSGNLINLSTSGLKVYLPKRLKLGSVHNIRIRGKRAAWDKNPPRELPVQARSIWCRRSATAEGYETGFTFTDFGALRINDVLKFFKHEMGLDIKDAAQKRRTARIAKRFGIAWTGPDGKAYKGIVRNLSLTGVQIATGTSIEEGTNIDVTIDLGEKRQILQTRINVVRCLKVSRPEVPRDESYEIGAKFKSLSEKDRLRLSRLVSSYMKDDWADG